jgi:hypothetical protein
VTRAAFVLVLHSLKRFRGLLIGLGLILMAFQFLLTEVGAYLVRQGAFNQLAALIPDFVRAAAGPSALAFMSFSGIVGLGYFDPVILAALVGLMIAIGTEPLAEIETRFIDLTLARPLVRADLVTRTVVVLVIAGCSMLAMMLAATWTGLACCAPAGVDRPSIATLLSLAASLATIMACWGGIALALAGVSRRRAVAGAVAGAAALGAYLLDYLGQAWEPARGISTVSPFHYFQPMTVIMGGALSSRNVLVLLTIAIGGTLVGYAALARRDV